MHKSIRPCIKPLPHWLFKEVRYRHEIFEVVHCTISCTFPALNRASAASLCIRGLNFLLISNGRRACLSQDVLFRLGWIVQFMLSCLMCTIYSSNSIDICLINVVVVNYLSQYDGDRIMPERISIYHMTKQFFVTLPTCFISCQIMLFQWRVYPSIGWWGTCSCSRRLVIDTYWLYGSLGHV